MTTTQVVDRTTTEAEPVRAWVARFDSVPAFIEAAEAAVSDKTGGAGWGGQSWEQTTRNAVKGDATLVPQAVELLEHIDHAGIETRRTEFAPSVAGAFPVVPEYLAGHPAHMRRKIMATTDRAPLAICIDLTSSGCIGHGLLTKRGTAALALAMLLSAERPVTFNAVVGLDSKADNGSAALVVIRIEAAPLEVATACHVLTAASFHRLPGYRYILATARSGGAWPWHIRPEGKTRAKFVRNMRAALDLAPADLFIPPAHADDGDSYRDPVRWINARLAEVRAAEEAAAIA